MSQFFPIVTLQPKRVTGHVFSGLAGCEVPPGSATLSPGRKVTSAGALPGQQESGGLVWKIPRMLGKVSLEVTETQDVGLEDRLVRMHIL